MLCAFVNWAGNIVNGSTRSIHNIEEQIIINILDGCEEGYLAASSKWVAMRGMDQTCKSSGKGTSISPL